MDPWDDDGMRFIPSDSILKLKAKLLHETRKTKEEANAASAAAPADELQPLIDLYNSHEGDLDAIFKALGDDPGKAKKYPPADATVFARKYLGGFYTYVNMQKIAGRIAQKRAETTLAPAEPEAAAAEEPSEKAPEAAAAQAKTAQAINNPMLAGLAKLYDDMDGDVEQIFGALGENAGKALKYPPKDGMEFAEKYLEGYYTYVEVRKAPKKAQIFAAVDSDPMAKALSALYTKHDGDIKAVFEILGENPGKALKYPPADADTFGAKYVQGFYTYLEKAAPAKAPKSGGGDEAGNPMIAALSELYSAYGGDMKQVFEALGEDPTKAIKHPPSSADDFATKYLEGYYTYYTAPEETGEAMAAKLEDEDEALTPMEVLLMLFPDVEPALLEAAFQEANGHLELTVELLLTAMFFSTLATGAANMDMEGAAPPPPPPLDAGVDAPPPPPALSDLQLHELESGEVQDQVLALTVPPGAVAGDLVRFQTPAGSIVAEVPEGVPPGQPFFVKLQASA